MDVLAKGIHQLDEKNPLPKYKTDLIPPSNRLPPPFEFERYARRLPAGYARDICLLSLVF